MLGTASGGTISIVASGVQQSILHRLISIALDVYGAVLDYFGRCRRFNITSYATRYLKNSSAGLSPVQQDQLRRCVIYASSVLDWPLNLTPIQKDRFRYVPESASIMMSLCCLFILASCQTFTSSIPNTFESVEKVIMAAQLMIELAPDIEHSAHIQGSQILKRADVLRRRLEHLRSQESSGTDSMAPIDRTVQRASLVGNEFTPNGLDFDLDFDGISALEPFWDFPILTARPW
jgi:hypothetical protein